MIQIYIDPRCIITYSSYYIQGLYEYFGKKNVRFSNKFFHDVDMSLNEFSHINDSLMLIIAIDSSTKQTISKLAIDFRDATTIIKSAYTWCDIYAKINYNKESTEIPADANKIVSIPPSFAIRYRGILGIMFDMVQNIYKVFIDKRKSPTIFSIKQYITNYLYLVIRRKKLVEYTKPTQSLSNYVFFISTLWNHMNCIESTNVLRAAYMRTCKTNKNLKFEGGFYIKQDDNYSSQYNDIKLRHHISIRKYITNTKLSAFVFNTPSCWDCHGWKLGEFLAMGKAIISSPITNELPETLKDRYHIHIIHNPSDIQTAIDKLHYDCQYRHSLEAHAKKYFETYASPCKVIEHIFSEIHIRNNNI